MMKQADAIRPFLKWPGRKYSIIHYITNHLPSSAERSTLVEPFLGSAAVFLNTNYSNYLLNDNNPDLISLYQYLTKEQDKFIKYCAKFFVDENNDRDRYYELREKFNSSNNQRTKAALFLYLNKHGFNGLCRYNSSGIYNVPFGSFKKINLPHDNMKRFYEKANAVKLKLSCTDFKDCLKQVTSEAVVYCDPPYVPISSSSSFTKYSITDFTMDNQLQLVEFIRDLCKQQNISGIISNSDTKMTRELYHDAKIVSFKVRRSISSNSDTRQYVKELLAIYNQQ